MEWNNGLKGGRNAEATTRRKWYGNSLAAALLFPSLLLASRCSLSGVDVAIMRGAKWGFGARCKLANLV